MFEVKQEYLSGDCYQDHRRFDRARAEVQRRLCGQRLVYLDGGLYSSVFSADSHRVVKIAGGHDLAYRTYIRLVGELGGENVWLPRIDRVIDYYHSTTGELLASAVYMERLTDLFGPERDFLSGEEISRSISADYKRAIGRNWWPEDAELRDALALIRMSEELCPRAILDLHSGNIMRRGSQLVITDPLSINPCTTDSDRDESDQPL